jgi:hypothetical protein
MCKTLAWLAGLFLLAFVIASPAQAEGHGGIYAYIKTETGIAIAPLIHGQMLVMNANRPAIVALAAQAAPDDAIASQLSAYVGQQYRACFWGAFGVGIADTESPLHVCTHGYLAGTQAMLIRLRDAAGANPAVQAMVNKVELEMLANTASLSICSASATPFNTAQVLGPQWSTLPAYKPVQAAFALLLLAAMPFAWHRFRPQRPALA